MVHAVPNTPQTVLSTMTTVFFTRASRPGTKGSGLDLGKAAEVSRIVIWNRPGCCAERTVGAELRVGNTSITQYSDTSKIATNPLVWKQPPGTIYQNGVPTTVDLNETAVGRWVTLQNFNPDVNDTEEQNVLQVAELQVFGSGALPYRVCIHRDRSKHAIR